MTEAEWLVCADPEKMLAILRGKASNRKLRLFACACVRRVWPHAKQKDARQAIHAAEQYADGQIDVAKLRAIRARASALFREKMSSHFGTAAAMAATRESALAAARQTQRAVIEGAWRWHWSSNKPLLKAVERTEQCRLLLDIFGHLPFRELAVEPSILAVQESAIPKMAQSIYDARAFDRVPLLADALEDAGCHDADILSHCRTPGEHVRGCWVVDLLLGKS